MNNKIGLVMIEDNVPSPPIRINQKVNIESKKEIKIGIIPKETDSISCCCRSTSNSLSDKDNQLLCQIKIQSSIDFDDNNDNHKSILTDILDKTKFVFNENKNNKNITWRDIGFQSDFPYKDIRDSGFISMQFIDYFITIYKNKYYNSLCIPYFPFALVAIKLCFFNRIFFGLFNEKEQTLVLKCYKLTKCNKKQIKVFSQMLKINSQALFIILAKEMIYLINKYKSKVNIEKEEHNYMIIDPLINSAIKRISSVLNQLSKSKEANFELSANLAFKIQSEEDSY